MKKNSSTKTEVIMTQPLVEQPIVEKENAIEISNLFIRDIYTNKYIIEDLNYQFEKGKIHYICGPANVGKTVLISHFNGLLIPEKGNITIMNTPIKYKKRKIKNVKDIRKNISLVFQFAEYQLFKSTIQDDIIFGPRNFGVKKNAAIEEAKKVIKMVGLDETFLPRSPFELSGGQKRRVAIAGVLAINSNILVFDEPGAGLDPKGEEDILKIMLDLKKQGKTIIIVSHSVNNIIQIADNIVVLKDKKIVKTGSPYEIFTDKELIASTNMDTPLIISLIEKLIASNKIYNSLYEYKPRTIKELVAAIYKIYEQKK